MSLINRPNLRLLPEWQQQSAVLITWPHQYSGWASSLGSSHSSDISSPIEAFYIKLAATVSHYQIIAILCYDQAHQEHIKQLLQTKALNPDNVRFFIVPSNDTWIRDYGPLSVISNQNTLQLLDFEFNAWGNKYQSKHDNLVNQHLQQQHAFQQTPLKSIPWVLEGGSIDTDGHGTLLTTSSCLLAKQRNNEQTKTSVEKQLQTYLGVTKILWLEHGSLEGDDTDGHVDTLARFTDPNTICYVSCNQPEDPHYSGLKKMEQALKSFRNPTGKPYRLIPLPWPKPKTNQNGDRLPATYANFLIINNAVLVPTYDDPADHKAIDIFKQLFPQRQIIALNCLNLIEQFGSLHCATMQLPEGVMV